jgi:Zn-dependent peptidase ImmA (M78 family)/transcriptional regulator with XRE-family HTH domain
MRVHIKPTLLSWARERAGLSPGSQRKRFPRLEAWERGEASPTLKQLEALAKAFFVPIGYLFLPEPPEERIPIPDLRTLGSEPLRHPSPDLLDTLYLCQRRQAWYRDYARSMGEPTCRFVGSVGIDAPVEETAERIRQALDFDVEARKAFPTWTDALRQFIRQADDLGILVMCSGVVGNNNHRKLDTEEFRGFALADEYAPLVFINGADTKAAQMFTLAHELAHIWLGESALSDTSAASQPSQRIERWCNRVAAELLVPLKVLKSELPRTEPLDDVSRLARRFKVSTLVIIRRIYDAGRIDRDEFQQAYQEEVARLLAIPKGSGGDFYLTQTARVSRRFARALIADTLEGQTLYRDAFAMLGIKKEQTFREFGQNVGCII